MSEEGILIAEDEENLRYINHSFLNSKGYTPIFLAADLKEARRLLSEHGEDICLIVMCLNFPDGYGISLLDYLLISHPQSVGVIIVTANCDPELKTEFYRSGTDKVFTADYLEKPVQLAHFEAAVQKAMGEIKKRRSKLLIV